MQLDHVVVDGDPPTELTLHPGLTVIAGDQHTVAQLAEALPDAWLGTTGDELPVVGPEVVPPPDTRALEALRDRLAEELATAEDAVATATKEIEREERRRRADATKADADREDLAEVVARVEDLTDRRDELARRAGEVERDVARAAASAEAAAGRVDELGGIRTRLEAMLPVPDGAVPWRLGDRPDELAGLLDRAAELTAPASGTLDEARRWVDALGAGTAPVHPEARALAEADTDLTCRWGDATARGVDGDPDVVEAAALRERVTADAEALEALSAAGTLGATARREIERAHRAAVDAEGRDAERARAEETRVVTRYGYDSYLDFTVSTRSIRDVVEGRLQALRDERTAAEEALATAREGAARRIDELAAAREKLRRRAAEVLGHPADDHAASELRRVPQVPAVLGLLPAELDDARELAAAEHERHAEEARTLGAEQTRLRRELAKTGKAVARAEARRDDLGARLALIDERLAATDRAATAAADRRDGAVEVRDRARRALEDAERSEPAHTVEDLPAAVAAVVDAAAASGAAPSAAGPSGPHPILLIDAFAPLGDLAVDALDLLADDDTVRPVYLTADDGPPRRVAAWDDGRAGVVRLRRRGLQRLRPRWGRRRGRPVRTGDGTPAT